MEQILSIKEGEFENSPGNYEGYEITTDRQVIQVGIYSGQSCCENYGCILSNDDISEFIGAELFSIEHVDEALHSGVLSEIGYCEETSVMFVNLNTSKGLLQLVAYNTHNGYYGHSAVLISSHLKLYEVL